MKKIILMCFLAIIMACESSTSQSITNLNVTDFEKSIKANDVQLIDVRTADEFEGGFLRNAKNMDVNEDNFEKNIQTLDKAKPVYVYCLSGGRSSNAAKILQKNGFTVVYNMEGGIMKWKSEAKEIVFNKPQVNESMTMEAYMALVKKDKPVLVEFFAPWCAPCKILKPIVEKIGEENKETLEVVFIDVDKHKQLADELKLGSIPVLMYYQNGKKKWGIEGAPSEKDLRKKLKL